MSIISGVGLENSLIGFSDPDNVDNGNFKPDHEPFPGTFSNPSINGIIKLPNLVHVLCHRNIRLA